MSLSLAAGWRPEALGREDLKICLGSEPHEPLHCVRYSNDVLFLSQRRSHEAPDDCLTKSLIAATPLRSLLRMSGGTSGLKPKP